MLKSFFFMFGVICNSNRVNLTISFGSQFLTYKLQLQCHYYFHFKFSPFAQILARIFCIVYENLIHLFRQFISDYITWHRVILPIYLKLYKKNACKKRDVN